MKKRNGFTLVELLAVIVILALIMIVTIPAVLDAVAKARKENFYMFAQSLNSKATNRYIQDLDENPENTNCAVYDISTDLGISNVGDYEGWVKVLRTPVKSGKVSVSIELSSQVAMENAKYCIAKGSQCTPDTGIPLNESATSTKIIKTIKEGQVMCANYQYGSNGVLNTSNTVCRTYGQGTAITDTYNYDVEITLTDKNYVVQDYLLSESSKSNQKAFYDAIDNNKKTPPAGDDDNPTKIASPRCQTDTAITYKGLSNHGTTKVTTTSTTNKTCNNDSTKIDNTYDIKFNTYGGTKISNIPFCTTCSSEELLPKPTRVGYTFDGWYYDSKFERKVDGLFVRNVVTTEKRDTGNCLVGYNDVQLYAKWNSNGTTSPTEKTTIVSDPTTASDKTSVVSEPSSTPPDKTTNVNDITTAPFDTTDTSILLESLTISDYDIEFDPHKFSYSLNVPNTVTNLFVSYKAMEPENAEVSVQGDKNLAVGTNHVSIDVYNIYTGKRAVYNVIVKRFGVDETFEPYPTRPYEPWDPSSGLPDPALQESNALLKSLIVSGYIFDFDPQVYNYNLEIRDEEKLNVTYRTQAENAIVVVTGTDNIKDGSKITINVQSQNGYYHKTYTINLIRNIPESNTTKTLRRVVLVLGIILAIILVIIAINKNGKRKIIRKKDKKENDQNNLNNQNNQNNLGNV